MNYIPILIFLISLGLFIYFIFLKDKVIAKKKNDIFGLIMSILLIMGFIGYEIHKHYEKKLENEKKSIRYKEQHKINTKRRTRNEAVLFSKKYGIDENILYNLLIEEKELLKNNRDVLLKSVTLYFHIRYYEKDKTREKIKYYSKKYGISENIIACIFIDLGKLNE